LLARLYNIHFSGHNVEPMSNCKSENNATERKRLMY